MARSDHTIRARLMYWFDNSMSRGTPALVMWLGVTTLTVVLCFAIVLSVFDLGPDDSQHGDFFERLFASFVHTLDPGTVAGNTGGWPFLLAMLSVTIFGLFITSALIGVIASGIDVKLRELRRGRSIVLESDHTVILGWSESVFATVSELCIANQSRRRPAIVILSDRDKVDMEESIRAKVPKLLGTRVVCRTGSPMEMDALALTSHAKARSVIVLAPKDSDDPDSEVLKTLLALSQSGATGPRVVAEIRDPSNLETARLIGGERVSLLDVGETVAKLVVQTSRQSGAAAVYNELFDFGGDEIYFCTDHGVADLTYAQAALVFENACVIGVVSGGTTTINPAGDLPVGDSTLIVIAEDDSGLVGQPRSSTIPDVEQFADRIEDIEAASRTLLIGWNDQAPIILRELDQYVRPGSEVDIFTAFDTPTVPPLSNLKVSIEDHCPTTERAALERHLELGADQVIVLCYSNDLDIQAADARTLVTLLHTRDILSRLNAPDTRIVSELLDDRNRVLAQVANVDDVIVSGQIVSLITTQLSEDHRLGEVYDQLLRSGSCEIYLRPVDWYVKLDDTVSFATLVASGARHGESVIGYCLNHIAGMPPKEWVRINPAKSRTFHPEPGDRVIVLAEN